MGSKKPIVIARLRRRRRGNLIIYCHCEESGDSRNDEAISEIFGIVFFVLEIASLSAFARNDSVFFPSSLRGIRRQTDDEAISGVFGIGFLYWRLLQPTSRLRNDGIYRLAQ